MNLVEILTTFHPNAEGYTSFSRAHGIFSGIDHIFSHKSSLGKLKKIEIKSSIFSDCNAVRLDVTYRRRNLKNIHKHMEIKQYVLNNEQVTE